MARRPNGSTALFWVVPLLAALSASAQAPRFSRLYAESASASSFLKSDWNRFTENYHPNYALDDDPKTAWVEGVDGDGEGETLTIGVSALPSARAVRVELRAGYHKSRALFEANAAPREVEIRLLGPGGQRVGATTAQLERKMDWQAVTLEVPPKAAFAAVEIKVRSVHKGSRYKDTCISDVRIWVDSEVPYNARAEKAKHALLQGWIKERVAAAKYFKALPRQYPFATTHFTRAEHAEWTAPRDGFTPLQDAVEGGKAYPPLDKLFTAQERARVKEVLALAKTGGAGLGGKGWHRLTLKHAPRLPDGLNDLATLQDCAPFFDRTAFTLFEASEAMSGRALPSVARYGDMLEEASSSNLKVRYAPPPPGVEGGKQVDPPRLLGALYFWDHSVVSERSTYEHRRHFLVRLDAAERVEEIVVVNVGDFWSVEVVRLGYDPQGRIARVERKHASHWNEGGDDPEDEEGLQGNAFSRELHVSKS